MITRRQTVTATNILNGDNKPVTLASHLLQAFKRSPPHPQGVCPWKRFRRNLYRVTRSLGTNSPPPPIPMAGGPEDLFRALSTP